MGNQLALCSDNKKKEKNEKFIRILNNAFSTVQRGFEGNKRRVKEQYAGFLHILIIFFNFDRSNSSGGKLFLRGQCALMPTVTTGLGYS